MSPGYDSREDTSCWQWNSGLFYTYWWTYVSFSYTRNPWHLIADTSLETFIQQGQIPVRHDADGNVVEYGKPRETRIFNGRPFLMETALPGDVAILRAWKVDKAGNCVFRYTAKSFAPLMAKAAKVAIVEAENIVEVGEIDPNDVDLAGIFIDRIVPATKPSQVEVLKTRSPDDGSDGKQTKTAKSGGSDALERRNRIARRAAKELKDGFYVNLGVGIPTLAPEFLPPGQKVWIQSENGILGMGPYPLPDEVDP